MTHPQNTSVPFYNPSLPHLSNSPYSSPLPHRSCFPHSSSANQRKNTPDAFQRPSKSTSSQSLDLFRDIRSKSKRPYSPPVKAPPPSPCSGRRRNTGNVCLNDSNLYELLLHNHHLVPNSTNDDKENHPFNCNVETVEDIPDAIIGQNTPRADLSRQSASRREHVASSLYTDSDTIVPSSPVYLPGTAISAPEDSREVISPFPLCDLPSSPPAIPAPLNIGAANNHNALQPSPTIYATIKPRPPTARRNRRPTTTAVPLRLFPPSPTDSLRSDRSTIVGALSSPSSSVRPSLYSQQQVSVFEDDDEKTGLMGYLKWPRQGSLGSRGAKDGERMGLGKRRRWWRRLFCWTCADLY